MENNVIATAFLRYTAKETAETHKLDSQRNLENSNKDEVERIFREAKTPHDELYVLVDKECSFEIASTHGYSPNLRTDPQWYECMARHVIRLQLTTPNGVRVLNAHDNDVCDAVRISFKSENMELGRRHLTCEHDWEEILLAIKNGNIAFGRWDVPKIELPEHR